MTNLDVGANCIIAIEREITFLL